MMGGEVLAKEYKFSDRKIKDLLDENTYAIYSMDSSDRFNMKIKRNYFEDNFDDKLQLDFIKTERYYQWLTHYCMED